MSDETNRHKESLPNLGCIFAYLAVNNKYTFSQIAETYFHEQLDRQVFWILKSVPELLSDSLEEQADKLRAQIVFKSQMTSFYMFCFYKVFISNICERRKSATHMLEEYENNLCKLSNKEEDQFQADIFKISKEVLEFNDFFKFTGLKERSGAEVTKMLKEAIKNSERK